MGNSWIILVIAAAWWVIQAVVQAAAKKQEQQRLRELAEQRRRAAEQGKRPGATQASTATRPTTREELAARRQAQLEELRRRRAAQSRSTSGSSTTIRTGRSPAPAQRPPTAPGPTRPQPSPQPQPVQRTMPAASTPIAGSRTRKPKKLSRAQSEAIQRAALQADRTRREIAETAIGKAPPDMDLERRERTATAEYFRTKMHDRQSLRELFILKELLDRPLADRDESQASWSL